MLAKYLSLGLVCLLIFANVMADKGSKPDQFGGAKVLDNGDVLGIIVVRDPPDAPKAFQNGVTEGEVLWMIVAAITTDQDVSVFDAGGPLIQFNDALYMPFDKLPAPKETDPNKKIDAMIFYGVSVAPSHLLPATVVWRFSDGTTVTIPLKREVP